jgi:hypothetical protein
LRGKASREDGMQLPADVGEAFIATGITNARAEVYNRLVKIEEPLSLPVRILRNESASLAPPGLSRPVA